jgi:hypothetical protein
VPGVVFVSMTTIVYAIGKCVKRVIAQSLS